jgi:predicted Zn finger-like uncharacterized protein
MQIQCPKCKFTGTIADQLVPDEGRTVGCPKCKERFFIQKPVPVEISPDEPLEIERHTYETPAPRPMPVPAAEPVSPPVGGPTVTPRPLSQREVTRRNVKIVIGLGVAVALLFGLALLFHGTSSVESLYDRMRRQHPDYVALSSLPNYYVGSMTDVQKEKLAHSFVGKMFVCEGTVSSVESFSSNIFSAFGEGFAEGLTGTISTPRTGLPTEGTIVEADIPQGSAKIYLPENTTVDFISLREGQSIVFDGVIRSVSIGGSITFHVTSNSVQW